MIPDSALNSLRKLDSLQREMHVRFSRNFIIQLAMHRKVKINMFLSQKASHVSLKETQESTTALWFCSFTFSL